MLTGNMVRVKYARDRIIPYYIDTDSATWLEVAEQLLELFRGQDGRSRGEIEKDIEEVFGSDPGQLVHQGLIKLLEDRCEFEVVADHPPERLRETVFRAAAAHRAAMPVALPREQFSTFDRAAVLDAVARELGIAAEEVERGLFADLKTEQRLIKFKDISPKHLLERYNVALAQSVLLRSTRVHLLVHNEPPRRYRQLLRQIKFHRLICEMEKVGPDSYKFHLDGPLSLFSATQKYGLQLAFFLPTVLLCRDFELRAELRWGAQRKPKQFTLTPDDGLVSHAADHGTYVPPELGMFVELFRKRRPDWEIIEETEIYPLDTGFWVPDFRLRHKASGKAVLLEVLGFWRKASAETHLARLRKHVKQPFLLAVSDQLRIEETDLEGLPAGIHRFRQMPLPDEIARLAAELLGVEEELTTEAQRHKGKPNTGKKKQRKNKPEPEKDNPSLPLPPDS